MNILRPALHALSRHAGLRRFSEHSKLGRRFSARFVAGTSLDDALEAAREANRQGIAATLDSLGENVRTPGEARAAADVYHRLLDAIGKRRIDANISIKLTQMGIDVQPGLAFEIVSSLVEHAAATDNFVRVDMEGSEYTQGTIDMVCALHRLKANHGCVGVVIQAYLYRSAEDVARLLAQGIRIRLCKGAYQEPGNLAFPAKADVDANFIKIMQMLLRSGIYHGIATHDERMIAATRRFASEQRLHNFEFQMLYGIWRSLQRTLATEGQRVRVYIPFGSEWYPYSMRRLAERPANLLFLARNIFLR